MAGTLAVLLIYRQAPSRAVLVAMPMILFGLALAHVIGAAAFGWFHAKVGLVLVLTAYQIWMARYAGSLARGERRISGKALRLLNEVPGVVAVLIVILVEVKPF